MQATTTLPEALHEAPTASGMTPRRATRILGLVPPAGQHQLLAALEQDPQNTFPRLADMYRSYPGNLAELLHTTWENARQAANAFRKAVQR